MKGLGTVCFTKIVNGLFYIVSSHFKFCNALFSLWSRNELGPQATKIARGPTVLYSSVHIFGANKYAF